MFLMEDNMVCKYQNMLFFNDNKTFLSKKSPIENIQLGF